MKERRLRSSVIAIFLVFMLTLCACSGKEITPDFADAASFEAALNNGDDLTGKTVKITVTKLVPDSAFGYNIQTGEHLNFCSSTNPGVKDGDSLVVKVTEVRSMLGSYIIAYEKQ